MSNLTLQHTVEISPQARPAYALLAVNAVLALPLSEMLLRIDQEIELNPALEREVFPCAHCGHAMEGVVCGRCGQSILSGTARLRGEARRALDVWDEDLDPYRTIAAPSTLADHLEALLALHLKDADDLRIGRYLIGCLDRRGLLDGALEDIAADLNVDLDAVERVLHMLQHLEPLGVGARSIQECLLIQLQALAASPVRDLAIAIVTGCLPEIAREHHARVASALGVTAEEVRGALAFMREHLYASPAERYAADHRSEGVRPEELALPDVVLHRTPGGYTIEINGAAAMGLRINPVFRELLAQARAGGRGLSQDEVDTVRAQVARARLFIETMRRRNWTLYNCVEYIVRVQSAFLDGGPEHLRPLTMTAVARALGVSESTVSRALDSKFVQMPDGRVVGFSVFFDQSSPIKERIKAIVAAEDAGRPLADGAIARLLAGTGTVISRRTVAKYRDELRIPSSAQRRRRGMGRRAQVTTSKPHGEACGIGFAPLVGG